MIQEDKQKLDKQNLLMYLCMALPYDLMGDRLGVTRKIISVNISDRTITLSNGDYMPNTYYLDAAVLPIKPYLRPLSSMTEEEKEKLKSLYDAENVTNESICFLEGGTLEEYEAEISFVFCYCIVEWLLENHFDFMGLIPKGLAIEINKDNNPYKK